ncbi:glycosyltransferase family 2 protein [Spirosoma rhododendri]|uniref:Glycosyltransferase n=1 Tax=Spirosoma rhododendri TaxID=2728024 RepID=A0A7L5DPD7_9BACT|nr:glycosyltransferase family 2 protein [Spirosoma rhododendri]QJD78368.1 glycosyltransferase [Spirosoma rhododendri]
MARPLISVITVVYNARPTLEATLKSVLSQKKDLFEYWIIDGGSTDGSVELIRQYENQITGWITEPDGGIYDAMNKGINRSTGKWLYFLGGDDTLRPDVFEQMRPMLKSEYDMVFGDVMFDNGHRMQSFMGIRTMLQNTVHHQSAFYNSAVFSGYRYRTDLKIVSDYDLNLKLYVQHAKTQYVPIIVADCATGGASSELHGSLSETNAVRSSYVRNKWKDRTLSFLLRAYYWQKQLRFILYGHRV